MRYSVRAEGSSEALLSSEEGGSVVLVGSGQPMKAFTAALKTMKQGERASLKIKPECEAPHTGSLLGKACGINMLRCDLAEALHHVHITAMPAPGRLAVPWCLQMRCALVPHHMHLTLMSAAGRSGLRRDKSNFVLSVT